MNGFKRYWICALLGMLAISIYPIYMGVKVIYDMSTKGVVPMENFPKYIIPYTPISIAVLMAVLVLPIWMKCSPRWSVMGATVDSLLVFFVSEWLFESKVIVAGTVSTTLESWQMFMCYVPPQGVVTRTWTAVDVLMGEYSPTFKIHFYLVSVVLIMAVINCLYGFARMIVTGDFTRRKALVVQTVCTVFFLGLCILACFTAFFRDGEITVSPLSAGLMSLFFITLGVTVGVYVGSFLLKKGKLFAEMIPAVLAVLVTLAMYIGEMFLLSGHLYRYGTGGLFEGIPGIVLAPVDILIILVAGSVTAGVCRWLNKEKG